jgi:hypothetical protein
MMNVMANVTMLEPISGPSTIARQRNRPRIALANDFGGLRHPAQRGEHRAGSADRFNKPRWHCSEGHGGKDHADRRFESIQDFCRLGVTEMKLQNREVLFAATRRAV